MAGYAGEAASGCSRPSWSKLFETFFSYFSNPVSEFGMTYHSDFICEDLALQHRGRRKNLPVTAVLYKKTSLHSLDMKLSLIKRSTSWFYWPPNASNATTVLIKRVRIKPQHKILHHSKSRNTNRPFVHTIASKIFGRMCLTAFAV